LLFWTREQRAFKEIFCNCKRKEKMGCFFRVLRAAVKLKGRVSAEVAGRD
jgi:hypothetical protein